MNKGNSDYMKLPFLPGDAIPVPEAQEVQSHDVWSEFQRLHEREHARFADTQPLDALKDRDGPDTAYAPTMPAALPQAAPSAPAPVAPVRRGPTLDEVMAEARRFNRVCPQQPQWLVLYEVMLSRATPGARERPPSPVLTGPAWKATPSLSKRMVFREHLEWADRHGALGAVSDYLKALPEPAWYHMGD